MADKKYLTYKNKPLVRSGNTLYYGDPKDPFVVRIQILETKPDASQNNLEIASKVQIYLVSTDQSLSLEDTVVKSSERSDLFDALDFAVVWLERALRDSKESLSKQ